MYNLWIQLGFYWGFYLLRCLHIFRAIWESCSHHNEIKKDEKETGIEVKKEKDMIRDIIIIIIIIISAKEDSFFLSSLFDK